VYYEEIGEAEELLTSYAQANPDYLNAQKYLFEFQVAHKKTYSLPQFQVDASCLKSPLNIYIQIFSVDSYF